MKTFTILGATQTIRGLPVTIEKMELEALDVSDGYHTLSELYDHRRVLCMALFNTLHSLIQEGTLRGWQVFKSRLHSDGSMYEGYFIVELIPLGGGQISYHYELQYWDDFRIPEVACCPEYDGHTSKEVLERLALIA